MKTLHSSLLACLLVIASVLSGCASVSKHSPSKITSNDLLFSGPEKTSPSQLVSRDSLRRDISLLLYALETGYGGRRFIEQERLRMAVFKIRAIPDSHPSGMTVLELRDAIDEVLLQLPDNHLHARLWSGEQSSARLSAERKGQVGQNILRGASKVWELRYRPVKRVRVPILSIQTFPAAEDAAWNGFQSAVRGALRSAPAFVIDLRGNGGGSDAMGWWLAEQLLGHVPQTGLEAQIKSQTPATMAMLLNSVQLKIAMRKEAGRPVPDYLLTRLEKVTGNYRAAIDGKLEPELSIPEKADASTSSKSAFNQPVYVLIDAECASSCESTLELFEKYPQVVTVGENTAGSVHFGNMGILVLPHSRIIVQMGTDYWKFKDNRFVEKVGYSPRLRVAAGTDALDVALRHWERKK